MSINIAYILLAITNIIHVSLSIMLHIDAVGNYKSNMEPELIMSEWVNNFNNLNPIYKSRQKEWKNNIRSAYFFRALKFFLCILDLTDFADVICILKNTNYA